MNTYHLKLVVAVGLAIWSPSRLEGKEIHLSAAASLKEALLELSAVYSRSHEGIRIFGNFGASGALAKQIENGAPAGIFVSANKDWVEYLIRAGVVDSQNVAVLAYNALVFVGHPGTKAAELKDLPKLERIAIGSPRSVPAGQYAVEALSRSGLASVMDKKLVLARDVREALAYVDRGEADGAFVYKTDVPQGKRVRVLFSVSQELYSRITYPMGLTSAGAGDTATRSLFDFLLSSEAKGVLKRYGFAIQ
jgi:molybdate transport system substrate-binding protein